MVKNEFFPKGDKEMRNREDERLTQSNLEKIEETYKYKYWMLQQEMRVDM